jgi:hypothetical protein
MDSGDNARIETSSVREDRFAGEHRRAEVGRLTDAKVLVEHGFA